MTLLAYITNAAAFTLVLTTLLGCGRPGDNETKSEFKADDTTIEKAIKVALLDRTDTSTENHPVLVGVSLATTSVIACPNVQPQQCTSSSDGVITSKQYADLADRRVFKLDRNIDLQKESGLAIVSSDGVTTISVHVTFRKKGTTGSLRWKALLMTGDDSINAFDNAREKLTGIFSSLGVAKENIRNLSRRSSEQTAEVKATNPENIQEALDSLKVGDGDACLIHMTSHGSQQGFYLRGMATLSPAKFAAMLDKSCGNHPTIVLVSACYSGVFINDSMKKPNRVILTAARHDRTSFGCGPENEYTYWDNCLIDNINDSKSWPQFQENIVKCIVRKEGGNSSSQPQGFFGEQTSSIPFLKAN